MDSPHKRIVNHRVEKRLGDTDINYVKFLPKFMNFNDTQSIKKLFISFKISGDTERDNEIFSAIRENVDCKYISDIFIITESDVTNEMKAVVYDKIKFVEVDKRPTFRDVFNIVNDKIKDNEIAIISNADIFFDVSISLIDVIDMNDTCIALTRYDKISDKFIFHNRIDSQDCWIFKGKIRVNDMAVDFYFGERGCDNRLAHEILMARYKLNNYSLSIKAYHLHESGKRNYDQNSPAVPKPYHFLKHCKLPDYHEFSLFLDKKVQKQNNDEIRMIHMTLNYQGQKNMSQALKNMSDKYYLFEWKELMKQTDYASMMNMLYEIMFIMNPNIIFMQIQGSGIIFKETIDIITYFFKDILIINWTGDVREPIPRWYMDVGLNKNVLTCFTNQTDVRKIRKLGCKSEFLQIGFEHDVYNGQANKYDGNVKKETIVMFANHYGNQRFPLSQFRFDIVKKLMNDFGDKFSIFGSGWPSNFNAIDLNKDGKVEAKILNEAKIVVGASHFNLSRYSSDRLFRALGSGAFYISHRYEDIDVDFESGKHLETFRNYDELKDVINYYLEHEEERKQIANNGIELIHKKHRWSNRAMELKNIIDEARSGRL